LRLVANSNFGQITSPNEAAKEDICYVFPASASCGKGCSERLKSVGLLVITSKLTSIIHYIWHSDTPGVDGRIILRWIFKKWDRGSMDWIDMAQDRDRWRAVVSAVMNLRVP
jgi:hypothetical protein